ncbi:MAG: hypothetical protein LUE86_10360, partial [Clostridiales bacterium]|nr:hypothetical protein [Clostridiales bacterium]
MNQKITGSGSEKTAPDNVLNLGKSIPETILRLSAPAILEQFLVCLASLIDTAMVGSIGAAATASVAINISTVWLVNSFITALSVGFSFLVSHSVGEGNRRKTESAVRQSISASVLLGLLLTVCVFVVHSELPRLLGAAPDVLPNAQAYLGILSLGLVPQTLGVVLSAVFRSAGNTRIPLAVNLTSNLLNVIGNFLLIYPVRQISLPGFGGGSISIWGAGSHVPVSYLSFADGGADFRAGRLPFSETVDADAAAHYGTGASGTKHSVPGAGCPDGHDFRAGDTASCRPLSDQSDRGPFVSGGLRRFLYGADSDRAVAGRG